eukprot:1143183-Pelagomonas_calceolata.AAC.1
MVSACCVTHMLLCTLGAPGSFGVGQTNRPVGCDVYLRAFLFENKYCIALFPGFGSYTSCPHNNKEFVEGFLISLRQVFEQFIGYAVWSWGLIICEGLDTRLEGAAVQDGAVEPFPLPWGIIFSPGDGSF